MTNAQAALIETLCEATELGARWAPKSWRRGWRVLGWLMSTLTVGRGRKWWNGSATTIGPWIGLPDDWEAMDAASQCALLRHELVHVRQFRWAGLGSPVLGILPMAVLYFGLPLPTLWCAWTRYRLELAGYREQIATHERLRTGEADEVRERAVRALSGAKYGLAWPSRLVRCALGR